MEMQTAMSLNSISLKYMASVPQTKQLLVLSTNKMHDFYRLS